jgi:HTH-type transcriptional regulator/antitoxin HigA
MARALHEHLGIPAEVLLRSPRPVSSQPAEQLDWTRFPLKTMAKLGWIPRGRNPVARASQLMTEFVRHAGAGVVAESALYRKSPHARANTKSDPYALRAWCWKALAEAREVRLSTPDEPGILAVEFLRQLAHFSWSQDGPRFAAEFLARHGIAVLAVPLLPRTYLDGAALRLEDGTPVIGLTLRYDRIDNFWHRPAESLPDGRLDAGERAAGPPGHRAGRVRHEERNYRLLSQFVGMGEVRHHFARPGNEGTRSARSG